MDGSSQWAATAVLVVALLLIVLLAAAQAALSTISRTRLRALSEQGVQGAAIALRLIEDMPRLRTSVALVNMFLLATATGAGLLLAGADTGGTVTVVLAVLVTTYLLQVVTSAIGARWYLRAAPALAPLVHFLLISLAPLHAATMWMHRRLAGSPAVEDEEALRLGEEEMRVLATVAGDEEVEIHEDRREMIYSVVSLAQTTVREVMVPRPDLVALRSDMAMQEALDAVVREGHSRIPVYEDSVDNIIGVLYAKDLLAYLRDGRTNVPIRDMLRPAIFVPTSKMADELLEDLQRHHVHLAIVFDEYGGTAGLVTIEDILEEIVGEIQDEYDAEEEAFVRVSDFEAIVSGRLDIDDLNHEMDLELPTNENDTVGGLIYSALGRVPLVGDEVRMDEEGVSFCVIGMAGRRITNVRLVIDHDEITTKVEEIEEAQEEVEEVTSSTPNGSTEVDSTQVVQLRQRRVY